MGRGFGRLLVGMLSALLVIAAGGHTAVAQDPNQSIIFVVDTSGSMGGTPLEQAKEALTESVQALDDNIAAGLRSYACDSTGGTLLVPVDTDNREDLLAATASLTSGGNTGTGDALRAAVGDLPPTGERTVVLISDGATNCGEPPCVVAQDMRDSGVAITVHTVGFNAPSSAELELQCVADATGGQYFTATDAEGLADAISGAVGLEPLRYVALGDSYSSGEGAGAGNYFQWHETLYRCTSNYGWYQVRYDLKKPIPNWDCTSYEQGHDIDCHRAPTAWSWTLAADSRQLDESAVANHACSGATIEENLLDRYRFNEQPQADKLEQLNAEEQVDLVTFTIGGNDVGFEQIVKKCYLGAGWTGPFGNIHTIRGSVGESCSGAEKIVDQKLAQVDFERAITRLHAQAPEATLAFVSYPQVVPDDYDNVVGTGCDWLSEPELRSLRSVVGKINLAQYQAVEAAKAKGIPVVFVDITDALLGHEICTADSHVVNVYGNPYNSEQAHPSVEGQADIGHAVFNRLVNLGVLRE